MSTEKESQKSPPYIPWKTFESYVADLKGTGVHHQLDSSVRPSTISGGMWRQLLSTLQFFEFIDSDRTTTAEFKRLVDFHGTENFRIAAKELMFPKYKPIIGDLPLRNATPGQLRKHFKENGGVDGQVLDKGVRFFLHVLKAAEIPYSPAFSMRKVSSGRRTGTSAKRTTPPAENGGRAGGTGQGGAGQGTSGQTGTPQWGPDMNPWPLYFVGKSPGMLVVPQDVSEADCDLIENMLTAIRVIAKQKAAAAG